MSSVYRVRFLCVVLTAGTLVVGGAAALAQTTSTATGTESTTPQPPPVGPDPETVTSTFGDWSMRCRKDATAASGDMTCDVTTVIYAQGQQLPFAQVTFAEQGVEKAMHVTALVPVNIRVTAAPRLATTDADKGLELPWQICLPSGCVADMAVNKDELQRLRDHTKAGRLTFLDGAGNEIRVIVSFRGLAQALDAVTKSRAP